jgi:hypothetical protein
MRKFKLTHPALEYVEGHDDQIIIDNHKNNYGFVEQEFSIMVPGKMIVCPTCGGTGTHVRQDIDDSAMVDSMYEDGDYEGIEHYFNGGYDVQCTQCKGNNVVFEADWEQLPQWAKDAISYWDECERESAAIQAAERAMGA